jgi:hypothetical protein
VKATLHKVRWSGYDRTGDTWEPITHLQGYASMVKEFKESHEKDVERLAGDRRCESESKEAHALKNTPNHTVVCMNGLTSTKHVSDGDWGFLPVRETNQVKERTLMSLGCGVLVETVPWLPWIWRRDRTSLYYSWKTA